MIFGKRSHSQPRQQRRRSLRQSLRLEHLEQRRVFAGLSPVAVNDLYHAVENETLEIAAAGVLSNDSDAEGDPLTALEFRGPAHGSLTLNADGGFVYTPNADFSGTDGFIYQVDDGNSRSHLAVVTLQIAPRNSAPQGQSDSYLVSEDGLLDIGSTNGLLANDSDVDGDALQAILNDGPAHGTLELNPDGSFTYQPADDFAGSDAFTYLVSDGALTSEPINVEITVSAVNDAPRGENDRYDTNEDEALVVSVDTGVLANDSDVDDDALTAVLDVGPEHGTLELNADGSFTYTPDENYNGLDAFTYQVSDGAATSELIVVEFVVNSVNDAPVGENDAYSTNEDETLTVLADAGVLINDSDVDGDAITTVLDVGPEHGTLELNADGSFTYTPDENYNGLDAFTYRVSDGTETSDLVVVEITVNAVNDAPVGENDAYSINEDETLTVLVEAGVLANDSDVDGDALTAVLDVGPEHGALELNADGSFTYTPDENYNGPDAFTYLVSDGTETSELIVVEITVEGVNDAPVGENDAYTINEDETLTVVPESGVLANDSDVDGDALTAVLDVGPEHGALELNADGSFTYTPDENYNGPDAFTYLVSDGTETSELIVVEITVEAVNDAPVGENDAYTINEDETLTVVPESGVLANDSDVDGDALTAVLDVGPEHGTLELNADGSFTYTPDENYNGLDAFTYRVSDGTESSELIVVEITIEAVNDAPVGENDAYTINEDETLTVVPESGVLANDSDVDGDALTAVLDVGPEHGTLELNADGSFTYTPDENYNGLDAFTYRVGDGTETSELIVVEITIEAVNDAPLAESDAYTTNVNEALVIAAPGVLDNDSDIDGDVLTAVLAEGPTHGQLTLADDGSFVYQPDPDYIGADEFSYLANDGIETALAVVSIRVRGENERPIAVNDVYRLEAGAEFSVAAGDGVLKNDSDGNQDSLQAILFRGPQNGSLTLNSDGSFSYTPNAGFVGLDSFLYRASDGELNSPLAVVTLRVRAAAETSQNVPPPLATGEGEPIDRGVVVDEVFDAMALEDFLMHEFEGLFAAQ